MKNKAFSAALSLLTRREHGAVELTGKLKHKGFTQVEIQEALTECQSLGFQSDRRFSESLCRARIRQGYGPLRIRRELQEKFIDEEIINEVLALEQKNWLTYAHDVRKKKYKATSSIEYQERQKQKQFLYYRGFALETIEQIFKEIE